MYSAGEMPFCINNNAARGVTATSLDKRDAAAGCIPGTYSCDIGNSQILLCDNDQYWGLVAVCGSSGTVLVITLQMEHRIASAPRLPGMSLFGSIEY